MSVFLVNRYSRVEKKVKLRTNGTNQYSRAEKWQKWTNVGQMAQMDKLWLNILRQDKWIICGYFLLQGGAIHYLSNALTAVNIDC